MKVKIRNYRTFHTSSHVYYNYMNKRYSGSWDYHNPNNLFEAFLEKLENMLDWVYKHTINKLPDSLFGKRVKVRIDPWDTYSMDTTLAYIILPMLIQMKETKHGAPIVDLKDVPEELHPPEGFVPENPWEYDENYFKRWDWVLTEMIYAFEATVKEGDDDYSSVAYWDKEGQEAEELHYKRQKQGFELFGKYYRSLWD